MERSWSWGFSLTCFFVLTFHSGMNIKPFKITIFHKQLRRHQPLKITFFFTLSSSWGEKKSWMHIYRSLRMVAVPLIMPEIGRCRPSHPVLDWPEKLSPVWVEWWGNRETGIKLRSFCGSGVVQGGPKNHLEVGARNNSICRGEITPVTNLYGHL